MRKVFLIPFGVSLVIFACSESESGTIEVISGDGGDPFAEPPCSSPDADFCGPAPSEIQISEITIEGPDGGSNDGNAPATVIGTAAYDGGATINLPQVSSDNVEILQATAFSGSTPIIFGRTLPIQLGGAAGISVPLFVQRMGQFAYMPSSLMTAPGSQGAAPLAAVFQNRYLFVAASNSMTAELYDLVLWTLATTGAESGSPTLPLPCAPSAMAPISGTTYMLLVCGDGSAAWQFDVSLASPACSLGGDAKTACSGSMTEGPVCGSDTLGGSWSDIAGGSTVYSPDGYAFIVGATRKGTASSWVLRVPPTQNDEGDGGDGGPTNVPLCWLQLNEPRQGAAAVWADGYGLVLAGGETGDGGTGSVEFFSGAASDAGTTGGSAAPASFTPPNPLPTGAGAAVVNGGKQLLLAGGTLHGKPAAIQIVNLNETDGGKIGDASAPPALPLVSAQAFVEQADATPLFIGPGADDAGYTRAFLVSGSFPNFTTKEVPLKNSKRVGTTAILSPVPQLIVLGGGDNTMESYIPAAESFIPSP
jgi:hypothetical protein